jgi:transcriptional regulator with XRE-family HTH domain
VTAGAKLRLLRTRLGMTTRDVSLQSHLFADARGNTEFYISNPWLTQVETTNSIPSLHKLVSLSSIYRITFASIASLFGVDLECIGKHQIETASEETHLVGLDVADPAKAIVFPDRLEEGYNLDGTNLFSRIVQHWGEIPIAALQHLDLRTGHYGFIGLRDLTLYPLLRPGSFVQINPQERKIQTSRGHTEFDRPIYFLELRDSYACGWCELQGNQLTLIPHPLSPCSVRRFDHPRDVEVVGRVVGVAMRLGQSMSHADEGTLNWSMKEDSGWAKCKGGPVRAGTNPAPSRAV